MQLGEAERIEPGRPPVQFMLGDCFFVERNYPNALAQYEKTLELAQQEQGACWRMGRLYEADHQVLKAIDAFQKARTLNTADPINEFAEPDQHSVFRFVPNPIGRRFERMERIVSDGFGEVMFARVSVHKQNRR